MPLITVIRCYTEEVLALFLDGDAGSLNCYGAPATVRSPVCVQHLLLSVPRLAQQALVPYGTLRTGYSRC
jgi:hypothetical protein